jgi:hypothetical protein
VADHSYRDTSIFYAFSGRICAVMSDLCSVTVPRRKRCPPDPGDDSILTPKKLRIACVSIIFAHEFSFNIVDRHPTPPKTSTRKGTARTLPDHLGRLQAIQATLQHALSHALATCAVSPSSDTGIVCNVLNHISLSTSSGPTAQLNLADLRRLCWLWEWDGTTPHKHETKVNEEDNPFLEQKSAFQSKDWTRGSMGFILSPTTHFVRSAGKRIPAYGIGIEVEMDLDKDMSGGMAAVARWTAAGETRRIEFRKKLDRWVELHLDQKFIPHIPSADLPQLAVAPKTSSLTRVLASASPSGTTLISPPGPPSSPSRVPRKSPVKISSAFAVPFPITPPSSISAQVSTACTMLTPCSRRVYPDTAYFLTPSTPSTSTSSTVPESVPSTPVHQRGPSAYTAPQTPTSRREAIYERVRQRSLSASPTKGRMAYSDATGGKLTKEQMTKMGQEEMRRRCLLGRLGGIAESVWM